MQTIFFSFYPNFFPFISYFLPSVHHKVNIKPGLWIRCSHSRELFCWTPRKYDVRSATEKVHKNTQNSRLFLTPFNLIQSRKFINPINFDSQISSEKLLPGEPRQFDFELETKDISRPEVVFLVNSVRGVGRKF